MSALLLRFGLWTVLISLALYVISETFPSGPTAEFLSSSLLQKIGLVGVLMVAVGFVVSFFDKAASKVMKQRCTVCRKPIPHGEIYCREHLRRILEDEDHRRHATPGRHA